MYQKQLIDIGLSLFEAMVYEFLAVKGLSSASHIARQTGIQRTMVYIVLKELQKSHLVAQDTSRKVTRFHITSPTKLERFVEHKAGLAKTAQAAYDSVESQLKHAYGIQSGQPGVRFFEGLDGLKKVYADLNSSGTKEVQLVRSRHSPNKDMRDVISEQTEKQIELNIKVKIINSTDDVGINKRLHKDNERGTERRVAAAEVFLNPAQILIYGNKIAFTTYTEPMMSVILEHSDIAETIRSLYKMTWDRTAAETKAYLKKHITEQKTS